MVGLQYQAEVPSGLCHYKEEEKGDYCLLWLCDGFFNGIAYCPYIKGPIRSHGFTHATFFRPSTTKGNFSLWLWFDVMV